MPPRLARLMRHFSMSACGVVGARSRNTRSPVKSMPRALRRTARDRSTCVRASRAGACAGRRNLRRSRPSAMPGARSSVPRIQSPAVRYMASAKPSPATLRPSITPLRRGDRFRLKGLVAEDVIGMEMGIVDADHGLPGQFAGERRKCLAKTARGAGVDDDRARFRVDHDDVGDGAAVGERDRFLGAGDEPHAVADALRLQAIGERRGGGLERRDPCGRGAGRGRGQKVSAGKANHRLSAHQEGGRPSRLGCNRAGMLER